MSNAKKTIEFSIMNGLSQNAHITKAQAQHSDLMIKDIIKSLFSSATIWAVEEYLKELKDALIPHREYQEDKT